MEIEKNNVNTGNYMSLGNQKGESFFSFFVILCCRRLTFLLIGECVLVYFFRYQAKGLAWGNVSEMT